MSELFSILTNILLPIFIVMGIGFVMQKKFEMNLQTLARLNIYFLVPGFIFVKLHSTEISFQLFGSVLLFFILYVVLLFLIAYVIGKLKRLERGEKTTFSNEGTEKVLFT